MTKEIVIAIIASCTSLLVGVTTLIVGILNNRRSARSSVELEKLKMEFSRSTIHEGKTEVHLTEYVQALQGAIQAIQKVKDETQIALQASEAGQELDAVLREIVSARENIFAYYEKHLAILSKHEGKLLHEAKNISLQIEATLRKVVSRTNSALTQEHKQRLTELRTRLTDVQHGFRDSRAELILKRLGLPLSWLNEDDSQQEVPDSKLPSPESKGLIAESNVTAGDGPELPLKGLRILIAEDYADSRVTLTIFLEREGATVKTCISGVEAYLLLREWEPHILISDIGLPYEDGYQLIKNVRQLRDKQSQTPAIALTAYSGERDRDSILAAGYQRVVTKPPTWSDFLQDILELTGRASHDKP